jgi:DNA-binding transcriptional ArsR family regulator
VLRSAGLVRAERRGTSIVYTLQSNVLEDLASELIELATAAVAPVRARTRVRGRLG